MRRPWPASAVMCTMLAMLVPTASSADVVESGPLDPIGDVTGAPDVSNVVVHGSGQSLLFLVRVVNEPVLQNQSVIELRFDTDLNPATGSQTGSERLIHRLWTGSTRLCSWTGSGWSCGSSPTTTSTYVDGLLTATSTTDALGIAAGAFDYSVAAYNAPNIDFVPDVGTLRYSLTPATTGCAAPAGIECAAAALPPGPRTPSQRRRAG